MFIFPLRTGPFHNLVFAQCLCSALSASGSYSYCDRCPLGLVREALRFTTHALYGVYGPLVRIWFGVVGISLLRLPRHGESPASSFTEQPLRARREGRIS